MKSRKVLFALVLALVLCLGTSVALAVAEVNSEALLIEACQKGGTVKLTDDVEVKTSIRIKNVVTLDLNGFTLIGPDDGKANWYAFIVEAGGQLTLEDNSAAQTGELWAKCYGIETKGGTFIMNSGKITATKNGKVGAAVVNYGGNVIINDGTLVASHAAINMQAYFTSTSLKVLGGDFTSTGSLYDNEGVITIGGDWTNYNGTTYSETAQLMGGTVKGEVAVRNNKDADVTVSGGSYSTMPDNVTIAGDMQLVNGMYQIVYKTYTVPTTGDSSNIALWLSLMAISAAAFVVLGRKTRFN